MSSEADSQGEYVYYAEHEEIEDEYVYNENPSNDEYSMSSPDSSKNSKGRVQNDRFAMRPKHRETVEGIYDELDYDLSNPTMTSPTMDSKIETGNSKTSEIKEKNSGKSELKMNKKAIIILSILGTCIVGGITIGVILSMQGTEPKLNTIGITNNSSNKSTEVAINNFISNTSIEIALNTLASNKETTLVPFAKSTIGKISFVLNYTFEYRLGYFNHP